MENQNPHIEIKPFGSYLETDAGGYLVNPASLEKIQEGWKPVIQDVIVAYKTHFGEKLKSVYIRGSVAKGQAVEGISDIDSIAYIDLPKDAINHEWEEVAEKEIADKYDFLESAELMSRPLVIGPMNVILLNQAVCVYGDPIVVPRVKLGKEMMMHIPNLDKRIQILDKKLASADTPEKVKETCVWFAKDILRTGFELTMERSKRYTRDLYLCYQDFAEYYPNKESQMREVLDLALNPTSDKKVIEKIRDEFSSWLIEEAQKQIQSL